MPRNYLPDPYRGKRHTMALGRRAYQRLNLYQRYLTTRGSDKQDTRFSSLDMLASRLLAEMFDQPVELHEITVGFYEPTLDALEYDEELTDYRVPLKPVVNVEEWVYEKFISYMGKLSARGRRPVSERLLTSYLVSENLRQKWEQKLKGEKTDEKDK